MKIVKALVASREGKATNKAGEGFKNELYAEIRKDVLVWVDAEGALLYPVSLRDILIENWVPFPVHGPEVELIFTVPCIYCGEKINMEKEAYTTVFIETEKGGSKIAFAHLPCYDMHNENNGG